MMETTICTSVQEANWSEIEAIMASIDPNRASWISMLGYETVNGRQEEIMGNNYMKIGELYLSLEDWCGLSGFQNILSNLKLQGFDSLYFLNGILQNEDTKFLGITSKSLQTTFLTAIEELPNYVSKVNNENMKTVPQLLNYLQISSYLAFFTIKNYVLIEDLKDITEEILIKDFAISPIGHRRRLLLALQNLNITPRLYKEVVHSPTYKTKLIEDSSISSGVMCSWHSTAAMSQSSHIFSLPQSLSDYSASSQESATVSSNIHHVRSRSATDSSSAAMCHVENNQQMTKSQTAAIYQEKRHLVKRKKQSQKSRKPSIKHFAPEINPEWPHHPSMLLKNEFSYLVSYIGFKVLSDFTNQSEVLDVIEIFRCKSADILKLPTIRLVFKLDRITLSNPDNDSIIGVHKITDIYCAQQDLHKKSNFAYVIKDSHTQSHHCHCFASNSPETATLILQTLAQTCQLADQVIHYYNNFKQI